MKEFTKVAILVYITVGVAFITIGVWVSSSLDLLDVDFTNAILVVLIIGMIPLILIAFKMKSETIPNNRRTD